MVYEDDLDTDVPVFDSDDLDTDAQFSENTKSSAQKSARISLAVFQR